MVIVYTKYDPIHGPVAYTFEKHSFLLDPLFATNTATLPPLLILEITFTEEKRTNKTAVFSRVVSQLNSSYGKLSETIEDTRRDTERIINQKRDVTIDISTLVDDNRQVEDWVKELMTVIDALGKGGERRE